MDTLVPNLKKLNENLIFEDLEKMYEKYKRIWESGFNLLYYNIYSKKLD